jgi:hypothetical protein
VTVLIGADFALIFAQTIWLTAIGAALWGLQMVLIQGLLSAVVADASPRQLHQMNTDSRSREIPDCRAA